MSPTNVKVVFIGAICFVLWGGYNIAKAGYTAFNWTRAEGTVVDFERNTWSCGKGVGECYSLIVSYQAGNSSYTVTSEKKFNRNKPSHLLNDNVVVYYSPTNHGEAVLGGSYGPVNNGILLFVIGCVVLIIFRVIQK